METIVDTNGNTHTVVESTTTEVKTQEVKESSKEEALFIQTPIFLLFAEFLGFVSGFITQAEDWCNPRKPMPTKPMQTFMEREARAIYDSLLENLSEEEIHKLYKNFYLCGLDELEDDLIEKRKSLGDELPF